MKLLTLSLLLLFTTNLMANKKSLFCSSKRLMKSFNIKNHSVSFQSLNQWNGRAIASVENVRTKRSGNSMTKILKFEGHKYYFHISDLNNFSDVEDYIAIKSRKGHQIMYPLSCEWI